MTFNPTRVRQYFLVLLTSITTTISAQLPFWSNSGNNATPNDFLGTSNNQPLILKSNGTEGLRILPGGAVRLYSFLNSGNGLVTSSGGILGFKVFSNDTTQVFIGNGSFKSISALSGWTYNGNVLYNAPGTKVGIGITNPIYPLEVQGSAFFHGIIYADGVVLANKMLVDTLKTGVMFTLNNNLNMRGGSLNEIYTTSGDLRIQSHPGYSGNTVFNAGVAGNVGIGTFNPQHKLDVNGDASISAALLVYRIKPLTGDSVIRFGDSTIYLNPWTGNIFNNNYATNPSSSYQGLGLGDNAYGAGHFSTGIGYKVRSNAVGSITIGGNLSGGYLVNNMPSTLMIGFNSNIPTIFVGPANGNGTVGKVGIGTIAPTGLLQIGNNSNAVTVNQPTGNSMGFMSTIGFNVYWDESLNRFVASGDGNQNSGSAITQDSEGALRFYVFPNSGGTSQSMDQLHFESESILTLKSERVQIGEGDILPVSTYNTSYTKLTVNGRVMCKDLVVSIDADWPDYVFDSTYTVLSMDSLQTYVNLNKHLPGSAPADSVMTNGVSYSELCKQQQKQIEEMTLYILELNQRLNALEQKQEEQKESEGGQK